MTPARATPVRSPRTGLRLTVTLQIDARYLARVDAAALRKTARTALLCARGCRAAALTLVITGDAMLRSLNRRFRGVDAATDVLAFPAGATDAPGARTPYLGDVVVSYSRAAAQARAAGHGPMAELQLLVAHGVLHLLGYDHATAAQRKRMWAVQARILRAAGAPVTIPSTASQVSHG